MGAEIGRRRVHEFARADDACRAAAQTRCFEDRGHGAQFFGFGDCDAGKQVCLADTCYVPRLGSPPGGKCRSGRRGIGYCPVGTPGTYETAGDFIQGQRFSFIEPGQCSASHAHAVRDEQYHILSESPRSHAQDQHRKGDPVLHVPFHFHSFFRWGCLRIDPEC